jgi:hypothetical protein
MTPPAVTAAGRSAAAPRPARAPGHRDPRRAAPGPRGPRRVSGPARGRSAPASRRTSLPARGLLLIRGLPEHTLLDRIIRGRAWIPLLGVLLVGIVGMQVEILKLGTGMGRWIERSSTLSAKNEALQANVAALMDDQRIETLAAKMGMVMPDPTTLSFLSAQPGVAAQAAANIHSPDPSGFASQIASQVATAQAADGTSAPGTSSTDSSSTGAASVGSASTGVSNTDSSGSSGG